MNKPTSETPKIILHWLDRSRAQRILWLLIELGVQYEIKTYKRDSNMLAPPELKAVHGMGKSPIITIGGRPIAESAFIIEYLCDHFGPHLIPRKWKEGCEGEISGETEEWMRFRYFMHYSEGSLMSTMVLVLKSAPAPFFIRPIVSRIAAQLHTAIVVPGFATHLPFLEEQLASAPAGGPYLCGEKLTGADIMISFPLLAARQLPDALTQKNFPRLWKYTELIESSPSYKRAVEKVVELEGEYILI
ncbi:glutathione S-transferase-like protein [Mycena alexandri]|uniref:Glutathione S-transferase-like protein n=1 Tax=Mycena alexandri TaxID=1745969 RepID=A0AAD6XB97_9AGAR|nr:glutathione S-transferase-like protein [Mycena alexandri]